MKENNDNLGVQDFFRKYPPGEYTLTFKKVINHEKV